MCPAHEMMCREVIGLTIEETRFRLAPIRELHILTIYRRAERLMRLASLWGCKQQLIYRSNEFQYPRICVASGSLQFFFIDFHHRKDYQMFTAHHKFTFIVQICKFIPRRRIATLARKHGVDQGGGDVRSIEPCRGSGLRAAGTFDQHKRLLRRT